MHCYSGWDHPWKSAVVHKRWPHTRELASTQQTLDAVTAQGRTCVALQLASGHTSVASSTGAEQLDTFCSVHSPTGWQRQGIVMLAWLGTPPTQPAAALPTISVL